MKTPHPNHCQRPQGSRHIHSHTRSKRWLAPGLALLALSPVIGCKPDNVPTPPTPSASNSAPAPVQAIQQFARFASEGPRALNVLKDDKEACPAYKQEELKEPTSILPAPNGVLSTQLVVRLKKRCVPVFDDGAWKLEPLSLRTYGFPKDHRQPITEADAKDPNSAKITWSAPGPTLVLSKATAPDKNDGTNFQMTLFNVLDVEEDPHACNTRLSSGRTAPPLGKLLPNFESPNCFHGDNSTNFHLHGTHVSPQEHQDYVSLELLPFGAKKPSHGSHSRGTVAVGSYSYNIARMRHTQAEGTHWYHAHKHGSTALQVLNGLIGTLEIRGAFDTAIEDLFKGQQGSCSEAGKPVLCDRLMVVQQLQEKLPGLGGTQAKFPVINGQANPIVKMKPGEIQRWRFVGATMQASAHLQLGFKGSAADATVQLRQIAADGVQFAPENYQCQPFLRGPDCKPSTEDDPVSAVDNFELSPGSRIDVLVQAPAKAGRYPMTFRMLNLLPVKKEAEELKKRIAALVNASSLAADSDPPLLTVEVTGSALTTTFPTAAQFPKMPAFLADLGEPASSRTVAYQMKNQGTFPAVTFMINGTKYDPSCVNETLTIGETEQWMLTNDSQSIAHPFHIHTNPFQLRSEVRWVDGVRKEITYKAPYPWLDVIPIPTSKANEATTDVGKAVIRYRPEEFTGEFVNHCHILGHEDRGMMHAVQVVCKEKDAQGNLQWGNPTTDLSAECRPGNFRKAEPQCKNE